MSHYELTPEQIPLIADANDPTTEVFIINGYFDRVTKGLGRVETQQPPGLYKVKFVAGSSVREVRVALEPGKGPVEVRPPDDVLFSTPAPIQKTSTTHEYHEDSAKDLSTRIHYTKGAGSQLFVFVRDLKLLEWEEEAPDFPAQEHDPAMDLSLHDLNGNLLVDFTHVGEREIHDPTRDPWVGCNIQLDPGLYRLRVSTNTTGTLEQIVVTSAGWQTQVFLLPRWYGYRSRVRRADLGNASIMMAPLGSGFQPSDKELRRVELVRQGLVNSRVVIDASTLRWMFTSKFVSPMLGIYGAHLLLLSQEQDHELLREVAGNLHALLGPHPDVESLDIWLGSRDGVPVFQAPPMLRSSWKIIVNASIAYPEIVRAGSLAAQMADRVWGDSAWLLWQEPSKQLVPLVPVDVSELQGTLPQIAHLLSATPSSEPTVEIAEAKHLTPLEYMLFEHIAREAPFRKRVTQEVQPQKGDSPMAGGREPTLKMRQFYESLKPNSPSGSKSPQDYWEEILDIWGEDARLRRWGENNLTDGALVQALGVPTTVLREAAAGLIQKMRM